MEMLAHAASGPQRRVLPLVSSVKKRNRPLSVRPGPSVPGRPAAHPAADAGRFDGKFVLGFEFSPRDSNRWNS